MKKAQLTNIEASFLRKINEIDVAMGKADIRSNPVVYGILNVQSERATGSE
jgi:hypothetical protein